MERYITIPIWTKVFKVLGIYDEDYHEKYRKYIHEKRYEIYISRVIEDLQAKILSKNREQIEKTMKEKFSKPDYFIPDI